MNNKLDKNTVIGMILLAVMFFVFFWYNNKQQQFYLQQEKHKKDSIDAVNALLRKPIDSITAKVDSLKRDSLYKVQAAGNFTTAALATETFTTLENDVMKITFSNKGGKVKSVQLKKYTSFDGQPVVLGSDKDVLTYSINTGANNVARTDQLFFTASDVQKKQDGTQSIQFSLQDSASGKTIRHHYIIRPNDYLIDWNIEMNGINQLLSNNILNFNFKVVPQQHEKSAQYEKQMSNVVFSEGNSFDYISAKKDHEFEKPAQWIGASQQFFNTTLIAKDNFTSGKVEWQRNTDDSSKDLGVVQANMQMKINAGASSVPMQLYFGPNDYYILKNAAPQMDGIVNLGRDMYSFVRPVNKYIILPVFKFIASFVASYGWVIFLLTVFIRLITAPLTYGSYKSGAKMKVLKPELDALKKKFGDDQQGFAMEQMKFYREAGVNPLGGCIPALVQLPIFVALYSFFNSNIAVRGQAFLWSSDLSVFDSIAHLPFNIPGIGDHISLFTITAVAGQFIISIYNLSSTPTQDNPAMKYMPYIFPIMMFFLFNRLPAALTWYYTVSNVLTLLIQLIMQKYFIDHDKILAAIEAKRKNPKAKAKSKWQEKYEQVMESQKKVQELKNKTQNKK